MSPASSAPASRAVLAGPFRYKHLGSMATIGRKAAIAELGPLKLWGMPAWWLWGAVHVAFWSAPATASP